ncbi:hypothetical protein BABA_06176 [Neobacillus bataviensis LMG 21833]|uniref:DUF1878 domain-containing protein n=1 Tax=Neobacillus bataviensis LMG 21833 TaxID=1117379 RepID=K6CGH6_9BACI|nr:DUF1878 family protein [Neobacillus bataviensis]EKN70250.1 hypothetical protein BABA_06176 [Neobacillus bataviensis LMG 21833]
MNEYKVLWQRIHLLEYHQKLFVKLLNNPKLEFYKLVIENGLNEQETEKFFDLCDKLSMKLEEQKAEGYVYFHPLFEQLSAALPANLKMEEVIRACLLQNLYKPLFLEFEKYL